MEYTNLGRTGLSVSRLCLGTMNFGPQTTEPDSFAIMDRALEHGINFFDTANVYGWKLGEGVTEQIVGRWFAQGGGRREKVVLATKVYGKMGDWPERPAACRPATSSPACDASLQRLQTEYIDLYQMHHVSRADAVGRDLAGDGDAGRAGQGALRRLVQLRRLAPRRRPRRRPHGGNFLGLVVRAVRSTTCSPATSSSRSIPAAQQYGIGIIPWSPAARRTAVGCAEEAGRRRGPAGPAPGRASDGLEQHRTGDRGVREALRRPR